MLSFKNFSRANEAVERTGQPACFKDTTPGTSQRGYDALSLERRRVGEKKCWRCRSGGASFDHHSEGGDRGQSAGSSSEPKGDRTDASHGDREGDEEL